ncbi:MAG: helix-turn-helix domain-containing protein [Clostridiales bacterium]|nr:helix-turn-helix domain-containing protein [Clostridiales bacterium]
MQDQAEKNDLSMLLSDKSEIELSLCAAQALSYYLDAEDFFNTLHSSRDLPGILKKLADYLGEEIMLTNSFGKSVFQTPHMSGTLKKEMLAQYYDIISRLENHNLDQLLQEPPDFIYVKLHQKENIYGVLFISLKNGVPHDYEWILEKLEPYLNRMLASNIRAYPNVPPKFSLLWRDIMEGKYSSSEEIKKRFTHSGYAISTFFRLMLIQLNQPVEQIEYIFLQIYPVLKQLFPNSQLTIYMGVIVVLNWEEHRNYSPELSKEDEWRLEELMREYDGWICIGWGSRNMLWLPPLYRYLHKILNMRNQILETSDKVRIIPYSHYCPFLLVDMCAQNLRNTADIRDIMLLCHPAVINLFRYDQAHNTNLEEVLFYYIINHHSLEQTAQSLYMHRNTVANKIRKIRDMIPTDLNAPDIQTHLLISHYILKYGINIIDPNFVSEQEDRQ